MPGLFHFQNVYNFTQVIPGQTFFIRLFIKICKSLGIVSSVKMIGKSNLKLAGIVPEM